MDCTKSVLLRDSGCPVPPGCPPVSNLSVNALNRLGGHRPGDAPAKRSQLLSLLALLLLVFLCTGLPRRTVLSLQDEESTLSRCQWREAPRSSTEGSRAIISDLLVRSTLNCSVTDISSTARSWNQTRLASSLTSARSSSQPQAGTRNIGRELPMAQKPCGRPKSNNASQRRGGR